MNIKSQTTDILNCNHKKPQKNVRTHSLKAHTAHLDIYIELIHNHTTTKIHFQKG